PRLRLPGRPLALRARPGRGRRARPRARRDRRPVRELPRSRGLSARGHLGLDARLRRQVGDPPEPDRDRERRLRTDGARDRARAAHVRGLRGGVAGRRWRGGHGRHPRRRRFGAHLRGRPGARPADRPGLTRSRAMRERYEHFIGGASVAPRAGRYLETRNPATGKRLAEIARGDEADVDAAVQAAASALPAWRDRKPIELVGVVGVILPWNAPINQAARAAAPALAAGNVVVAKPSEFTSASLLELASIAIECGLPAGALNVVTGTGPEAGAALVAHGGVR